MDQPVQPHHHSYSLLYRDPTVSMDCQWELGNILMRMHECTVSSESYLLAQAVGYYFSLGS